MKPTPFPGNYPGFMFEYHRMREGPSYFLCHYKNSSVLRQDPKDAWRVLGPAKFTESAQALKQWAIDIHQQDIDKKEGRKDTSFASEALEEEPTDNTKMVT